ncbi:MAG TPA: Xaa-Pro peptidase family protein [Bacillota bacterium]|jgi:Xaa-Pro aminopeptidase|nr:Xaa-Pro peptidase family protein [Bacillota bacterium]
MPGRLKRLQEELKKRSLDAILITHPANRFYISGFSGSNGVLLISAGEAFLFTDFRYLEQAEKQSPHFKVCSWKGKLSEALQPYVSAAGWKSLAFEEEHVTYALHRELKEGLALELLPVKGLVEELRAVKSEDEVEILRRGAAIMDQAFEFLLNLIKPGMTEKEVALELEYYLRRQGSEGSLFSYIVASGERGSLPHGIASDKPLRRGELVTVDFTGTFNSYATDMTRTIALGEPGARAREIYEAVRLAQQEAREKIRPGMTGVEADALARDLIKEAGFGEYFGHGLGHGLGLEVHEQPVLSPRSESTLVPGMVVTIEPGIYIPGWGGVRIEDMVLITSGGAESLTASPRELIVI